MSLVDEEFPAREQEDLAEKLSVSYFHLICPNLVDVARHDQCFGFSEEAQGALVVTLTLRPLIGNRHKLRRSSPRSTQSTAAGKAGQVSHLSLSS